MYDLDAKTYMEASLTDERTSSLLSIANDCASCGVDVDVSCLEALDEQLLVAPMESFTELCWAEAIQDETMAMAMPPPPPPSALPQPQPPQPDVQQKHVRPRSRSIKRDQESAFSPLSLALDDYSGSFERTRPLAAKITLPLETVSPFHVLAFLVALIVCFAFVNSTPCYRPTSSRTPFPRPFPNHTIRYQRFKKNDPLRISCTPNLTSACSLLPIIMTVPTTTMVVV